jgi:hypothetical protein
MDIVVTVPKTFTHECAPGKRGLAAWIAEGDAAGETWSGTHWSFTVGGAEPNILMRRDEEIPFPRWKVSEGVAK